MFFLLLPFLAVVAHAVIPDEVASTACACSSGFIPVPVDATILVDPSNPNSTDTFRLQTTLQVFGTLCEPVSEMPSSYSYMV